MPSRDEPERGHQEALYTTPDMLRAEVRLLDAATGRDPHGPVVATPSAIDAAIAARPTLGADQAAAVRHLCSGERRVRVMEARAGTGKTFALEAVRDAYEGSGVPVIGTAWQGQAADVLQREAGIASQTAALLLRRVARGEDDAIPAGAVIVGDEASVMPTRALERLAIEAAWRWARLMLVGDRAQLPAIDAAGGFAALADRLGAAELTENRRQAHGATAAGRHDLAEGRAGDALALLGESGRLPGLRRRPRCTGGARRRVGERPSSTRPSALMLAHDRHEVAELNRMAREGLMPRGCIADRA